MIKRISKLTENESGQGMAEYGLIIALIAVVCVAAVTFLGVSIQDKFQSWAKKSKVRPLVPVAALNTSATEE